MRKKNKVLDELTDCLTSKKDDLIESGHLTNKQVEFLQSYASTGELEESLSKAHYTMNSYSVDKTNNPYFKSRVKMIHDAIITRATHSNLTTEGKLGMIIDKLSEQVLDNDDIKAVNPLLKSLDMSMKHRGMYQKNITPSQRLIINIDNSKHATRKEIRPEELDNYLTALENEIFVNDK